MNNQILPHGFGKFSRGMLDWLPFGPGGLLVLVIEDFSVRGLVCMRGAGRGVEIERFVEVDFETSSLRIRARIAKLLEALGPVTVRDVLVVTNEAQLFQADLPPVPKKRFGRADAKRLENAARWEIAPFLDYASADALIGTAAGAKKKDEFSEPDEAETETFFISSMAAPVYGNIARACREHRKRLVGVLPEEVLAFACHDPEDNRAIILDWRLHEVVAALIAGGTPEQIVREDIEGLEPAAEVEGILADLAGDSTCEIVVGGARAGEVDCGFWEYGSRVWELDIPKIKSEPVPSSYMTACGALNVPDGLVLDDRKPLAERFREKVHTLPLILICLLMLGMGGEYMNLKHQLSQLEKQDAKLTAEKKQLQDASGAEASLRKRYDTLKKEKRDMERDIAALETGIPARDARLVSFMNGLVAKTPGGVQLRSIRQFSGSGYFIEGSSASYSPITQFVLDLKSLPEVHECRIDSSNETTGAYDFTMRVRLEELGG